MGSLFYTFDEAAERLKKSKRQIHNYVKDGLLRKSVDNGAVVLHREDVEQLAVEQDLPAINRKTVAFLMARIQRLEQDMEVLRRIHNIRGAPLRPSEDEAVRLLMGATAYLSAGTWSESDIEAWSTIFDRLDEVALDMIRDATTSPKPYSVFFSLCLEMMKFCSTQEGEAWAVLHRKLDEGRKQLRLSALTWIEAGRGAIPDSVSAELDISVDDLAKRLGSKNR